MGGLGRWNAVAGGQARPAAQGPLLVRGRALRHQAEQARATSARLKERYVRAVTQSLVVCGQAVEVYAAACDARRAGADRRRALTGRGDASSLDGFKVVGVIDGQPVGATWTQGQLVCDRALWGRAELLVDLGEVFSDETGRPRYVASLVGPDVAVALTLLRACDRVAEFSVGIPLRPAAPGPDRPAATTP